MSPLECTQIEDLLVDYLYQELDDEQHTAFRAHLKACTTCAQMVRECEGVREAAREIPLLEPPKAISAQILHQAAKAKEPALPWLRQLASLFAPRRAFYALAAAASLVVVIFVGYAMQQRKLTPTFPEAERAVVDSPREAPAAPLDKEARPVAAPPDERRALAGEERPATAAPAVVPHPAEDSLGNVGGIVPPPKGGAGLGGTADQPGGGDRKAVTSYQVQLDETSVRRRRDADEMGFDVRNAARAFDSRKARQRGLGLQRSNDDGWRPAPAPSGLKRKQHLAPKAAPDFAAEPQPTGRAFAVEPKQQRAVKAPAPAAAQPARVQTARPAPPAPDPLRGRVKLKASKDATRAGSSLGYRAPAAGPQAGAPLGGAADSVGEGRREHAAEAEAPRAKARRGDGALSRSPADATEGMRAAAEYRVAIGEACPRQIKLLTRFIKKYPNDSRVGEARIRIAVCRARLTGKSDELDQMLQNIDSRRQKEVLQDLGRFSAPPATPKKARAARRPRSSASRVAAEEQSRAGGAKKAGKRNAQARARPAKKRAAPRRATAQQQEKTPAKRAKVAAKPKKAPAKPTATAKRAAPPERPAAKKASKRRVTRATEKAAKGKPSRAPAAAAKE